MESRPRRRDDRIFEPSYVDDLEDLPTQDLRKRRQECETLEAEISYTRRLLQGKVDILRAELERRSDGRDPGVESLKDTLPQILADSQPPGPIRDSCGYGRRSRLSPPDPEKQRRDVELLASQATLAHLDKQSTEGISEIVERLAEAEAETSDRRRRVQKVLDQLTAELVRRYREGRDDPTNLLRTSYTRSEGSPPAAS